MFDEHIVHFGKYERQQSFTFKFSDESVNTCQFEIALMTAGEFFPEDMPCEIEIDEELSNVTINDFTIDSSFIEKGRSVGKLLITMNKPKLEEATDTLAFRLASTQHFNAGYDDVYILIASDDYIKPDWWYDSNWGRGHHIGYWTREKMILWFDFMGITDGSDPWQQPLYRSEDGGLDFAMAKWSVQLFKDWLLSPDKGPFYDENGDLIVSTLELDQKI